MSTIMETPATIEVPSVSEDEGRRREILLRAAELIEAAGWTHGSDGMQIDGPFCLLGAIAHAQRSRRAPGDNGKYAMSPAADVIGVDFR